MVTPLAALLGLLLVGSPAWAETFPTTAHFAVSPGVSASEHPASLLEMTDEQLLEVIQNDPKALGSLSIGGPGSGQLFNGVTMPEDPRWLIGSNAKTWATTETVEALQAGIGTVHDLFPDTPAIRIGDVSDEDGGRLKRHKSHQCGRDVDVGFYFHAGTPGSFLVGTEKNLDLPRNWTLLRAWLVRTDVDVVLLDRRIQKLLYSYALSVGEDKAWLDQVFQYPRGRSGALIQHIAGHRNHYHVRFYNPVAQELGRRAFPLLVETNVLDRPVRTVRHVVRSGQTMGHVAARYGTSTAAIMKANGLRSTAWRAGRAYRIPVKGTIVTQDAVVIPPRPLPPHTPPMFDTVDWPTAPVPSADGSGGDR